MIDTAFDWMLAPLVWLVLLGGMLLSMEAGKRVRARHRRADASKRDAQPTTLAGPFKTRGRVVLEAGSTITDEMRQRNLSSDCACSPRVVVLSARPAQSRE